MDHDGVHDWVGVDCLQYCDLSRTQNTEELRDQPLGLIIIEYRRIIFLVKDELKRWVIDQLLDLLN